MLSKELIKGIVEQFGVANLKDDVAGTLAHDVEYRVRDIVQDAMKFMRHSRRQRLTTADVNHALKLRNVDRMYGFTGYGEQVQFKSAGDVFYVHEEEIDFDQVLNAPPPTIPATPVVTGHWLMVKGVQPAIPQNPAPLENRIEDLSRKLKSEGKYDLGQEQRKTEVKPLVRHVLSRELQIYYEKVVEALQSQSTDLNDAALESIRDDNGIQQLLPYFVQFITEQVAGNLRNLSMLRLMAQAIAGILTNQHFFVEPYLHQLMPPILSLLISKKICQEPSENHWKLRKFAAQLMASTCQRYGDKYQTLQPRVTRTLLRAFVDPLKAMTTHYGAIIGLRMLGADVVKALVVPNAVTYGKLVQQRMQESAEGSVAQQEASRCLQALIETLASYVANELKQQVQSGQAMDTDQVDYASVEHGSILRETFGDQLDVQVQQAMK